MPRRLRSVLRPVRGMRRAETGRRQERRTATATPRSAEVVLHRWGTRRSPNLRQRRRYVRNRTWNGRRSFLNRRAGARVGAAVPIHPLHRGLVVQPLDREVERLHEVRAGEAVQPRAAGGRTRGSSGGSIAASSAVGAVRLDPRLQPGGPVGDVAQVRSGLGATIASRAWSTRRSGARRRRRRAGGASRARVPAGRRSSRRPPVRRRGSAPGRAGPPSTAAGSTSPRSARDALPPQRADRRPDVRALRSCVAAEDVRVAAGRGARPRGGTSRRGRRGARGSRGTPSRISSTVMWRGTNWTSSSGVVAGELRSP